MNSAARQEATGHLRDVEFNETFLGRFYAHMNWKNVTYVVISAVMFLVGLVIATHFFTANYHDDNRNLEEQKCFKFEICKAGQGEAAYDTDPRWRYQGMCEDCPEFNEEDKDNGWYSAQKIGETNWAECLELKKAGKTGVCTNFQTGYPVDTSKFE
jgi:hypothetical protein